MVTSQRVPALHVSGSAVAGRTDEEKRAPRIGADQVLAVDEHARVVQKRDPRAYLLRGNSSSPGARIPDDRLLAADRAASVQCNSSSSGNSTTLSCSLGSVRAITAVQVSVWLEL